MKRTVDEIKSIRILKARNGIALIAVLGILLILTLLVPVMFSMGEIQMEDAMKGTRRQQAYYLARTGVEVGAGAVRNMVTNVYELEIPVEPVNKANANWMNSTQLAQANAQYNADLTSYNQKISALKASNPKEFESYELYQKLKTATSEGGGIFKDENGRFAIKCDRLWFYMKGDESVYEIKAATETGENGPHGDDADYTFIGYCDIEVSYDGGTTYYSDEKDANGNLIKVNKNVAAPSVHYPCQYVSEEGKTTPLSRSGEYYAVDNKLNDILPLADAWSHVVNDWGEDATSDTVDVIKEGYTSVTNSAFYITARSKVGPNMTEKRAVLVEPANSDSLGGDASNSFIEYAGTSWQNSPDFVKYMNSDSPNLKPYGTTKKGLLDWVYYTVVDDREYNMGGNQCFANPLKADYIQKIDYKEISDSIAHPYVYVYTKVGNMVLDVENKKDSYVLGVYPGIGWREHNNWNSDFQGVNYQDYSEGVQNYNFVSFCASEGLQCNLPIDVRVNPSRTGRIGDRSGINLLFGGKNADLFKMLSFQAKDIIFDGDIKMFFSFNQKKAVDAPVDYVVGRRMGTVVLAAPDNTPYTYYHQQKNTTVKAGKVYFKDDVYIWIIPWNQDGDFVVGATETYYKANADYWQKVKLFSAGDVYYFNAEIQGKNKDTGEMQNLGVSLVNWYLETQYLQHETNHGILDFFKNLRKNLFVSLVTTFADTDTYELDDMHYIGNINTDNGLKLPQVENEPCIFWEN